MIVREPLGHPITPIGHGDVKIYPTDITFKITGKDTATMPRGKVASCR
jgi:hypothetical protein